MKLSSAKLVVILLTIAGIGFSVGIGVFLLMPTFREINRLSDEIVRAHSELEAQYVNRKNLLSSAGKVVTARETVKTLTTQFLPKGRELDFITAVERIAGQNGAEERINLTVNAGGAEELRVSFDLVLTGPTPAVMRTILDLERMPTLLVFDSAVVRPGEGAPGGPSFLSVSLRGSVVAPPTGL